jgi:hypothetical protein
VPALPIVSGTPTGRDAVEGVIIDAAAESFGLPP